MVRHRHRRRENRCHREPCGISTPGWQLALGLAWMDDDGRADAAGGGGAAWQGGGLSWVLAAFWAVLSCVTVAMVIVIIDEFRRPPSNLRRMGAGIALIAGFSSLWLLVNPLAVASGRNCGAPLLVIAEFASPPVPAAPGCSAAMRQVAGWGLTAGALAPIVVLTTRGRRGSRHG